MDPWVHIIGALLGGGIAAGSMVLWNRRPKRPIPPPPALSQALRDEIYQSTDWWDREYNRLVRASEPPSVRIGNPDADYVEFRSYTGPTRRIAKQITRMDAAVAYDPASGQIAANRSFTLHHLTDRRFVDPIGHVYADANGILPPLDIDGDMPSIVAKSGDLVITLHGRNP